MEQLGYTVMKKDENGNNTTEVDWEKTAPFRSAPTTSTSTSRAATNTASWIQKINTHWKNRSSTISTTIAIQQPAAASLASCLRNKDGVLIGVNGPECGDIFFSIEEASTVLHGDSLSTSEGYFNTSVSPLFIGAGPGLKEGFTTPRTIRQVDVTPNHRSAARDSLPSSVRRGTCLPDLQRRTLISHSVDEEQAGGCRSALFLLSVALIEIKNDCAKHSCIGEGLAERQKKMKVII